VLQLLMRPSLLVNAVMGAEGPKGLISVRETERCGAGTPVVRSRTWQVMGSRGGGAEARMGEVMASAVSGIGPRGWRK